MKRTKLILLILFSWFSGITSMVSQTPDDQVHLLVTNLTNAWNAGDAHTYSSRFSEKGEFTNILGMTFYGKKDFEDRHTLVFSTFFKGSHLEQKIDRVQFIRADVAIVNVNTEITGYASLPTGIKAGPDGALHTHLLLVLTKERKGWFINAYHNVAIMRN
jgi:uncharacterized protein (TIGR02246 family)